MTFPNAITNLKPRNDGQLQYIMWFYYTTLNHNGNEFATMIRSARPDDLILTDNLWAFPTLKECINHRLKYHSNIKREIALN